MGTSPLPDRMLKTPPLGSKDCWSAGRGLILQGPMAFVGAWWTLTASREGQPASSVAPPPPLPPGVEEGSIPFSDLEGIVAVPTPLPDDAGYTAWADVEET